MECCCFSGDARSDSLTKLSRTNVLAEQLSTYVFDLFALFYKYRFIAIECTRSKLPNLSSVADFYSKSRFIARRLSDHFMEPFAEANSDY